MCKHNRLTVKTEAGGCSFVCCQDCRKRGPKKHSRRLAFLRFLSIGTQVRGTRKGVKYDRTARVDDTRLAGGL